MPFNPTLPVDHAKIVAAELRSQFIGLAEQIASLQSQLAPLVPGLTRSAGGQWTLTYAGPAQDYWLIWTRCSYSPAWSNAGDLRTDQFPSMDDAMAPDGASWWQVKICGEGVGDNRQDTPFSNTISFGLVPL